MRMHVTTSTFRNKVKVADKLVESEEKFVNACVCQSVDAS